MSDLLTRIRAGEFDQPQEQKKEDAASILARIRAGEFDTSVAEPSPVTKQIPELKEDELARLQEGGTILGPTAKPRADYFEQQRTAQTTERPAAGKIKNALSWLWGPTAIPKIVEGVSPVMKPAAEKVVELKETPAVSQLASGFYPGIYFGSPEITEALSEVLPEPKTTGNERLDKMLQKTGYFTGEVLQSILIMQLASATTGAGVEKIISSSPVLSKLPAPLQRAIASLGTGAGYLAGKSLVKQELPSAKEAAGSLAFFPAASVGGGLASQAIRKAAPAIHPVGEAAISGLGAGLAGGLAAMPFEEGTAEERIKNLASSMVSMALFQTVRTALDPSVHEAYRQRLPYIREHQRYKQAFKDLGLKMPKTAGTYTESDLKKAFTQKWKTGKHDEDALRRAHSAAREYVRAMSQAENFLESRYGSPKDRLQLGAAIESATEQSVSTQKTAPVPAQTSQKPVESSKVTKGGVIYVPPSESAKKPPSVAPVVEGKGIPTERTGKTVSAKTERGTGVDVQYAVVEADELITSHDTALNLNPAFPQELQPRLRERIASEEQISRIASFLEPEFLGESPKASEGAPIVGQDLIVESGNARTIALKRVYERNMPTQKAYREWLMANAEKFGFKPEEVANMKAPVLVRMRKTDVDRVKFVQEANEAAVAAMSAVEQARQDAGKIGVDLLSKFYPAEDGSIPLVANRDFIREFVLKVVPPSERGRYIGSDGALTQDGVRRIQNAIYAKAYEDIQSIEKLAESTDNNIKNITNAMLMVAPRMARVKEGIKRGDLYDYDLTPEMVAAANTLSSLRDQGRSLDEYLRQTTLFEEDMPPLTKDTLRVLNDYSRSRKRLVAFFSTYSDAVEAMGSPKQVKLMDIENPTKAELLQAVINKMGVDSFGEQTTLFGGTAIHGKTGREADRRVPEQAEGQKPQQETSEEDLNKAEKKEQIANPEKKKVSAFHISSKVGIVAGGGDPDVFRNIDEVSGKNRSLLSYERNLLPLETREQLDAIDKQAISINQKIKKLFLKNKVESPADLPKKDRKIYDKLKEQLFSLDEQREALRDDVRKALKGNLENGILYRLEHEDKSVSVAVKFVAKDGKEEVEVIGYNWTSPIEGKELFLPETPPPTNALQALLEKQPNIYEALFAPMRDVFGEQVVRPWRNAVRQYRTFIAEYEKILNQIFKPFVRNPDARSRITMMLEGEMKAEGPEGAAVKQLRKLFYGRNPNEGLFKQFEIDPDRFIKEYSPRVREHDDLDKAFPQGVPHELKFFAEMQRTGDLDPRDMDALTLAIRYLRAGAKKKFFDPVVKHVSEYVSVMHPDRRLLYEQFQDSMLGRPVMEERMIDGAIKALINPLLRPFGKELTGRPAQRVGVFLTNLIYDSTIMGNVFTAMKNLTQQLLAIGHLSDGPNILRGMKWWAKAKQAMATKTGKELMQYCWVAQDRQFLEGIDLQIGLYNKIMKPVRKLGYSLYRTADINNVLTSYMAGVQKALHQGKTLEKAIEYGNLTAASTQYLYGLDSPMLYKGPLGRILGAFTSWSVNFLRLLYEQGSKEGMGVVVATLMSLILGRYALEKVVKLNLKSITPTETIKGHPLASVVKDQKPIPLETLAKSIDVVIKSLQDDPKELDRAVEKFKADIKRYRPANTQWSRIERFIEAAKNDWKVMDKQGQVLYEMTPGEAVRSLIGPTVESQQRWEEQKEQQRLKNKEKKLREQMKEALKEKDMKKHSKLRKELLEVKRKQQEFKRKKK